MSTDKEHLIKTARENAGKVLFSVISKVMTPFEATKYFPKNIEDSSLKIAWHALLHYDADEDIRIKNPDYAQEQLAYLELLAKTLSAGLSLPQNILDEYENLYIDTVLPKKYDLKGYLKAFFRFLD